MSTSSRNSFSNFPKSTESSTTTIKTTTTTDIGVQKDLPSNRNKRSIVYMVLPMNLFRGIIFIITCIILLSAVTLPLHWDVCSQPAADLRASDGHIAEWEWDWNKM